MVNLRIRDEVIALAGVFQACSLVREIARTGTTDEAAFACCLASVTRVDARSAAAVFGGVTGLARGLAALRRQLDGPAQDRDPEITRYAAAVMHLERRLMASASHVERLRGAIAGLPPLGADGPDEEWIDRLAMLYVDTVGALGPRIEVRGDERHLTAPGASERVRALLLAGIRAAVLWRQIGGGRLRLLLLRAAYARAATALLEER